MYKFLRFCIDFWLVLLAGFVVAPASAQSLYPEPDCIAIVTNSNQIINGPIGLPPGGNLTLKAAGNFEYYTWYRNEVALGPTSLNDLLSVNTPGNYTVIGSRFAGVPGYTASLRVVVVSTEAADGRVLSSVQETGIRKVGITSLAQVNQLSQAEQQQQVSYLDGMGRTVESVQVAGAPGDRDLLSFQVYDPAGSSPRAYLPYAWGTSGVPYRPLATLQSQQADFYGGGTLAVATETQPWATAAAEASPLFRPLSASRVGTTATQHPRTVSYQVNTASDAVQLWTLDPGNTTTPTTLSSARYALGGLSKTVVQDEDGRTTITFQNELGQTVLQRQPGTSAGTGQFKGSAPEQLDTYTVYNDLGQVICRIPPLAVQVLASQGNTSSDPTFFAQQLYQYSYDERGRLISRQFPGAEPIYFVYDRYDRLVLTQDGNRRQEQTWYFTKYDPQGRRAFEGLLHDQANRSRQSWQNQADSWAGSAAGEERLPYVEGGAYSRDKTFPDVTNYADYLSFTFYDDYNLNADGEQAYFYRHEPLVATDQPVPDYNALGRPTVTVSRIVNADNTLGEWLRKVMFYDQYGNVIQTQSSSLLNDYITYDAVPNTTTLVYDQEGFRSQVTQSIRRQTSDNFGSLVVKNRYEYDPTGRLLRVWQQHVRDREPDAEVLVAGYTYNELGQLVEKNLHSQDGGASFLQSVDLRYNSNGQLTSFNNSELTADGTTNDDTDDVFGFVLNREMPQGPFAPGAALATVARYDGGITGIRWQVRNRLQQQADTPQRERAYAFHYDERGRLTGANYAACPAPGSPFLAEDGAYDENNIQYDANGNIKQLYRNTQAVATAAFATIDRLTYSYAGNQLTKVVDAGDDAKGFRDWTYPAGQAEYTYDANGSVTGDANKRLLYDYNVLNKVREQTNRTNNATVSYTYDAAGTVLRKTVQGVQQVIPGGTRPPRGTPLPRDYYYVDGVEYANSGRLNGLASVPTPEGRVVMVTGPAPDVSPSSDPSTPGQVPSTPTSIPPSITPEEEPEISNPTTPGEFTPEEESETQPSPRFVYEYHLRDHLGNLRVAFRAEAGAERQRHLTLEPANYFRERDYDGFRHTGVPVRSSLYAYEGQHSAAVRDDQPGPAVALPVAHGDNVRLTFYYRTPAGRQLYDYRPAPTGAAPVAAATLQLLPTLLAAPTGPERPAATPRLQAGLQVALTGAFSRWGRRARQQQQLRGRAAPTASPGVLNGAGGGGVEHPAYVAWTLRDDDGNILNQGTEQVPVVNQTDWSRFETTLAVDASAAERRTGHLTVQLLNAGGQYVYFDSLTIRQPQAGLFISQENHYYPFGMNLSGVAVSTLPAEAVSQQQYNGGSTLEDDVLDAEAGNYSTFYRRYDATIGRFLGVDPLADSYADQAPAQFGNNDPVNFNDPSGAFPGDAGSNRGNDYFPDGAHREYNNYEGSSTNTAGFARIAQFAKDIKDGKFMEPSKLLAEVKEKLGFGADTKLGHWGFVSTIQNGRNVVVGTGFHEVNISNLGDVFSALPDAYSIGTGTTLVAGVGFSISMNATWIVHGPEASWIPVGTFTGGWKFGFELGGSATAGYSSYNGPNENIHAPTLTGSGYESNVTLGLGGYGESLGTADFDDLTPTWQGRYITTPGKFGVSIGPTFTATPGQIIDFFREIGAQQMRGSPSGWQ